MSKNKLLKQLERHLVPPTGERTQTPAVLSDSKGKWLERKITNPLESNIKWWTKSGETTEKGYSWLKNNIKRKMKKHGQIWLYIWYGTCDLTSKNKKYIALTSETDSAIDKAAEYLGKIKELVKQYPKCRVTFLEIPVYSISEYNKNKDHKTPEIFKEQDTKLEAQIYKLNEKIRTLNKDELTYSPLFTTDIIHNSKTIKNKRTRTSTTRKTFSFWLYADGIHPGPLLAKVWLMKITKHALINCWKQDQ
ncbi:Hypothetical predicted protein [Mytilus galloprovincialis]|uniref:Uncharacterized protein n=1 Tax=Mytilus galloprovincialis TaxID=29158 RepID=A0A8B6FRZ3_MYTGA|nr:Hypothetical predicted protein [Mytilus galloprovincialis]